MRKKIIITCLLLCFLTVSKAQENEFGLMFNIANTTLSVPNGGITINSGGGISENTDNTGYKMNFAIGLYGSFNVQYRTNIGVELFYDKTSSKDLENIEFSAINLIPYFDYDIFGVNLFVNIGGGIGYIVNDQGFENQNRKVEKFDFIAKIALAYKFENIGRIEIGTYPAVTSVVKDYLSRHKYYIGIKFPIDKYLE
ncbi:hypothetical protein M8845_18875 [Gelidibacter japonicus]|jgi:opacity protein-like surface antigen|uniref:hypothetical protein n=1 Tax=Gelidibacter japonicus TaxID=1962232 RepID=UPI00201FE5FC|nr:hypothetical protein [Gelidibacter japonicus]MCL8009492.1 hypothetical protein [Gelidibacter japonicus]